MKKGKKVCIFIVLFIMICLIIAIINPIKRIRKHKIEKEILNYLKTGEIGENMAQNNIKQYEYALKDEVNNHNIDNFVKYYIDYIKKCILIKQNKASKDDIGELFIKKDEMHMGIPSGLDNRYVEYVIQNINEEDILKYEKNILDIDLAKKLEKKFVHNSDNIYTGWYIIGNDEKIIELPYNFYVHYIPNDKKNNKDIDEIIDFKIIAPVDAIDNLHGKDHIGLMSEVKYKLKNGRMETISRGIDIVKENDKICYSANTFVYSIFYTQNRDASFEVGQHDYDAYQKQWLKENDSSYDELPHVNWDENDE